jgi:hypothetical protein
MKEALLPILYQGINILRQNECDLTDVLAELEAALCRSLADVANDSEVNE